MQEEIYRQQIDQQRGGIDLDFWRSPEGVSVPDDELRFLLIPDAVEAAAVEDVARQVHRYQRDNVDSAGQITRALMLTMGGMLPGILIYDHLVDGRPEGSPKIEFGTIGVSLYKGPGVRYEEPLVQHGISIPVSGETVLLIDDLGDTGGTMEFLTRHMKDCGAHKALHLVLYMKPAATRTCCADFYFGETAQDAWIITPRERVETLVKRVPVWKDRGASQAECRRRLVDLIGYPDALVDYYLPDVYTREAG
jgi:hypoxanthine phosphoribosyltransferase